MFVINTKLTEDTVYLGTLTLCHVLLMNQREFPWIILVPEVEGATELTDLSTSEQMLLMSEINHVSSNMQKMFAPDKMNVAALGNVVPQLHMHIIARKHNDIAWPDPVWGSKITPYDDEEVRDIATKITRNIIQTGKTL